MSIREQQVDVRFLPVNQQAPNSSAPAGRLSKMRNSVADQFEGQFLKTTQRKGFKQLTKKVINPGTLDTATTGFAGTPELMSSLERQLLVVADCHPYSLAENAEEWACPDYILHTNSPRQRPIYTGNVKIETPDSACADDVVCYVWKETASDTDKTQHAYLMIRDLDGTVIVNPRSIAQAATNEDQTLQIKVVSDGSRFWVFYSATTSMLVSVFNKDGTAGGFSSFATLTSGETFNNLNAFWDVQFNCLGVSWYGQTTDNLNTLYTFTWASNVVTPHFHGYDGTITVTPTKPFWLTNPYDTTHAYIGFIHDGTPDTAKVEKFNASAVWQQQFNMSAGGFSLDNVTAATGYVDSNGDVGVIMGLLHATDSVHNLTVHWLQHSDGSAEADTSMKTVTPASRCFFLNGRPTCAMYFTDSLQPTFFLHDMRSDQMVGCWAHGSSAFDWQGTNGVSNYDNYDSFCVPSWYVDSDGGSHCGVGFLAESFARNFTTFTRQGSNPITSIVSSKFVSTIGLADFEIATPGIATEYADELMIPGTQSTCFTGMLYTEDNFNLFPSPVTFTQSHSDAGNLDQNKDYSIVVVYESTDTRGNRIKSRPSDPQIVTLTGTNNILTITGPTLFETFGKSNVIISVYSTYIDGNGNISTDHRKVTDDLNPLLNDKSSDTWSFILNKTSADIQVGEILYTDNGLLPHDTCPAHSFGCIAGNRMFVLGWDGAIWYSNEKTEGEPLTFNLDVLRVLMPTSDKPKAMKALDTMRIIIQCERTQWEFDISQLPGPDGLNGNVQSPKQLPFTNGCTGFATVIKEGIAYASSAASGGAWLMTRGLENVQLSAPEYSDLLNQRIIGIATNDAQRTMFALADENTRSIIRDGINGSWYEFTHPRPIRLLHILNGQFAYADDVSVNVQDPSLSTDNYLIDETDVPVSIFVSQDLITVPINFGQIKGMKCVWKFILNGTAIGPCKLLVDCDYHTEDGIVTEAWSETLTVGEIELAFEPKSIEMSDITIRLRSNYGNVSGADGNSFDLESITFVVGVDSKPVRIPTSRTPSSL